MKLLWSLLLVTACAVPTSGTGSTFPAQNDPAPDPWPTTDTSSSAILPTDTSSTTTTAPDPTPPPPPPAPAPDDTNALPNRPTSMAQ